MTRPRLVTGARLRLRRGARGARAAHPRGRRRLNPTAAEVLELCDGERTIDDIVGELSARYDGADVRDDVEELVDAMTREGLVVDAAA